MADARKFKSERAAALRHKNISNTSLSRCPDYQGNAKLIAKKIGIQCQPLRPIFSNLLGLIKSPTYLFNPD